MTAPFDLTRLSHAEKDTLIAALTVRLDAALAHIAAQDVRIETLEARLEALTHPPKTPDNASKPPSQGQKPDKTPTASSNPASALARTVPRRSRTRPRPRGRSTSGSSGRPSSPT